MTRGTLLLLALVAAGANGRQAPSPDAGAPRPNIILILADDLGYGELGSYGQRQILTPNLDRLATEGMRFTQFYAGSTVCAPSRSVLMTGKHTGRTRVRGNAGAGDAHRQMLRDGDVTVAEVLKGAGYATGLVGKWGLGLPGDEGHPNRQGFDEFFGFLSQRHAHNHYPDHLWRNGDRTRLRNDLVAMGGDGAGYATTPVEYAGDLFAEEAIAFVTRHQARPFFLFLSVTVPHANNERTRALGNGQEVPDYGPYADRDWSDPHKGQAAMITRLDLQVGRLMAHLRALGLDGRTLVMFSSDNGPHREGGNDPAFFEAGGPLRGIKRNLTEGGIRVPFLARWPGHVPAGATSGHVGYFGDLMATAAELAGVTPPSGLDSLSLVPTLTGRAGQGAHEYLYWEFHERAPEHGSGSAFNQALLLDGRWKALRLLRRTAPIVLYDLEADIGESTDVAARHPDLVARAARLLIEAREPSDDWPPRDAPAEPAQP